MFERTRQRARARARQEVDRQLASAKEEADRRLASAKDEVGRIAFEVLEEQFPRQVKERQRRGAAEAFVVGVGIGIFVRHLAGR